MEKLFTLEEAEELLPRLQPELEQALEAWKRASALHAEREALLNRILLAGGLQLDPIKTHLLLDEGVHWAERAQQHLNAMTELGVQVKDLELGLLDFPCLYQGEQVLLCWKLGETRIEHWHGNQEGFAGRKPLERWRFPDSSRLQ